MAVEIQNGELQGRSPASGEPLNPVATTDPSDVRSILVEMREAQAQHAARTLGERARKLRELKDAILSRGERLAQTIVKETGKPDAEAWLFEVVPTADLGAYWCEAGVEALSNQSIQLDAVAYPGKRAVVERVPRGVIGLITPWNLPMAIPLRTIFPALLSGNGVLFKPSEYTPRTAAIIVEAVAEVFGPKLLQVVQGGAEVGRAVVSSGVDAVVFTGGVKTGRAIAVTCAEQGTPVSLELGGNDPAIVLEDADVERAANGLVWSAIGLTGQNCAAIERVYILESIAAAVEQRAAALAKELHPGRDFGPLMNEGQLARVESHLKDAVEHGAKIIAGGQRLERPGTWIAPTVLTDVRPGPLLSEETFGPVLPFVRVKTAAEAVQLANDSKFGLTASVWTKNLRRGEEIGRQLRAGVVTINNHAFTGAIPALPWSGVGQSGSGVTNSTHCLSALTRPRALVVDARRARRELWWFPYTEGLADLGQRMSVLRGGSLLAKPRAAAGAVGALVKRWKT